MTWATGVDGNEIVVFGFNEASFGFCEGGVGYV